MHISGYTVCVDYSDYLSRSLERWSELSELTVITSSKDAATQELCHEYGLQPFVTDVFYANGAKFNKGAAIAEAYKTRYTPEDWVLLFDSDILPPENWREYLNAENLIRDNLYGAFRDNTDGSPVGDPDIAGFFHLFHVSDENAQTVPLVDTHWYHCGNYDTTFQDRWSKQHRIRLPLHVTHLGQPWENWCGRGRTTDMEKLLQLRKKLKGWKHETRPPAP